MSYASNKKYFKPSMFNFSKTPTDWDIELQYRELGVDGIIYDGLEKLGLLDTKPNVLTAIIIQGCYYKNIETEYLTKHAYDNNAWRSSNYEATVFFFDEEKFYSYTNRYSIIADEQEVITNEYFYRDIVSVTVYKDDIRINTGDIVTWEFLKIVGNGGKEYIYTYEMTNDIYKTYVEQMKQLINDKKASYNY